MDIKSLKIGIKKSSLLLALLVLSSITAATDIQLTWSTPELREDGSAIQEIEKFNLYYTVNNVLQDVIEIDALSNTHTLQNIEIGTHTLQISTVESGLEGDLSDPLTLSTSNSKAVKILLTVELIE